MTLLQTLQGILVMFDGGFQLLDIFRTTFAEGRLSLPVTLLPLLRGCIYLRRPRPKTWSSVEVAYHPTLVCDSTYWLPSAFTLWSDCLFQWRRFEFKLGFGRGPNGADTTIPDWFSLECTVGIRM